MKSKIVALENERNSLLDYQKLQGDSIEAMRRKIEKLENDLKEKQEQIKLEQDEKEKLLNLYQNSEDINSQATILSDRSMIIFVLQMVTAIDAQTFTINTLYHNYLMPNLGLEESRESEDDDLDELQNDVQTVEGSDSNVEGIAKKQRSHHFN